MSTSASPSQPAASHDDDSPSDPPALAARQPGPAISEGPSSTTAVHSTSDPSSSPSQGPPRLESGADDPSSVIDPKDAASLQLPSNHAGKSKEQEEDKLDRFSCHIWCARPFGSAMASIRTLTLGATASKYQTNRSSAPAVTCTAGPACTRCVLRTCLPP